MEICNFVQEVVIKTIPKKHKCNNAKWLSEKALQRGEKRREAKRKGQKGKYTHLNAEFERIARRDKKALLSEQCKKKKKKQRKAIKWGRLEMSSRKLETAREHFM